MLTDQVSRSTISGVAVIGGSFDVAGVSLLLTSDLPTVRPRVYCVGPQWWPMP